MVGYLAENQAKSSNQKPIKCMRGSSGDEPLTTSPNLWKSENIF